MNYYFVSDHTFQDQTSPRTNTLFDDADDIQRQLDNEARDRLKFGRVNFTFVTHFTVHHLKLLDNTANARNNVSQATVGMDK